MPFRQFLQFGYYCEISQFVFAQFLKNYVGDIQRGLEFQNVVGTQFDSTFIEQRLELRLCEIALLDKEIKRIGKTGNRKADFPPGEKDGEFFVGVDVVPSSSRRRTKAQERGFSVVND